MVATLTVRPDPEHHDRSTSNMTYTNADLVTLRGNVQLGTYDTSQLASAVPLRNTLDRAAFCREACNVTYGILSYIGYFSLC